MASRKRKVIALSLGQGFASITSILVLVALSRSLNKDDLAAYQQTLLAYAIVAPFLQLGIGQAMLYFLSTEKMRIRGRVVDALTILTISGTLFATFIACGGNQLLASSFSNPKVAEMLLWMIPYAIITTPGNIVDSVLIACGHVTKAAIVIVSRRIFVAVATVVPVLLWSNPNAAIIGNVVASILFGLEAIFLMVRATPSEVFKPSLVGMKEMLAFSAPLGLAGMLGTISLQSDKFIVSVMCEPEQFAVYSLGAFEIPFLGVVTGSIAAVFLAEMRKAIVDGKVDEAVRLFRLTAEKTSLIIFPVAVFLFFCAEPFIKLLFSNKYTESAEYFRLYLIKLPYRVVVFGSILMALGQSQFILRRSFVSLILGVFLKICLVYFWGPVGAIIGALIVAYTYVVPSSLRKVAAEARISFVKVFPWKVLFIRFVMCLPIALVSWFSTELLSEYPPQWQLVMALTLVGPYCLWWWNGELYRYPDLVMRVKSLAKS